MHFTAMFIFSPQTLYSFMAAKWQLQQLPQTHHTSNINQYVVLVTTYYIY